MTSHRLGSWILPSGDSADVDLIDCGEGLGELRFFWDCGPPFAPSDESFYKLRVLPEVMRRVQEYRERTGRVLVLTTL